MITRRRFLTGTAALAGPTLLALAGCTRGDREQTAQLLRSALPLPERFTSEFRTPPVKTGRRVAGGTAYEIVQRAARTEILPGVETEVWGYDGLFPGPTIRARQGETVIVRHRNQLPVPTVVHLHGGHTPAASDGYPTDYVLPESGPEGDRDYGRDGGDVRRGSRDYVYPTQQRAATLWYHDHRLDFTGPAVWAGLAGLHLVTDDEEEALDLPSGERDVPILIADRSFAADGSLAYPALDPRLRQPHGVTAGFHGGLLGDVLLVNGVPWPELAVAAARYRLRLVNGSNARRYALTLDPAPPEGPSFVQVGSDGGLLAAPVEHEVIPIAAAERFDVVVDFGRYPVGALVTLRNGLGAGGTDAVMRFRVVRGGRDPSRVPARLSDVEPLRPPAGATVREWHFSRGRGGMPHWAINGRPFDPNRMDAYAPLGQAEIWRFRSDVHHPVHVHLDPFQVLRRDGGAPQATDAGWKDTVDIRAWETVEVAVRFTEHTGRYLLHCHDLEHEDMMMMAGFATVAR